MGRRTEHPVEGDVFASSLVCDVQELYRHLIDDVLIQYCQDLTKKDFVVKTEPRSRTKQGKRVYLDESKTHDLMNSLDESLESYVDVPRMHIGKQQTIQTLTNEKASLLAKFFRTELDDWSSKH